MADQKRVAAELDLLVELGHLEAWQNRPAAGQNPVRGQSEVATARQRPALSRENFRHMPPEPHCKNCKI